MEIGPDLPSIIVPWRDSGSGLRFVDLRQQPEAIEQIMEACKYPALGVALTALNGPESEVFTSKCDVWQASAEELDRLDLGISQADLQCGIAAYIDVVLREAIDFASFELQENWLRRLTAKLHPITLPAAQVEFTLRWAQVEDTEGFATTIHLTGCGCDQASALQTWEAALKTIVAAIRRGLAMPDLPAPSPSM